MNFDQPSEGKSYITVMLRYFIAANPIYQGLAQLKECADRGNADESHLLLFDPVPKISWDEKIWRRHESYQGSDIQVWEPKKA
ncbi:MAG: hypothetical protein GF398_11560 [Chitinivibrionales bacterium]|nr:hypothetical protein [Chitinivibrionales bacterium]